MASSTHIPPDPSLPEAAESLRRGHETTDVSLRAIIVFMVVVFIGAAAIQVAVWGLMRGLQQHNEAADPTPSPFAQQHEPPPEPRLQPSLAHQREPYEDMNALNARWQHELTTYARVPGEANRARIPIEAAMRIIAERGLSPTTQPGGAK